MLAAIVNCSKASLRFSKGSTAILFSVTATVAADPNEVSVVDEDGLVKRAERNRLAADLLVTIFATTGRSETRSAGLR